MNLSQIEKQKQFLDLYDPLSERLSRFIRSMVWNNEDARDIASETVLITWQKFDKIESDQVFLYYMFSIASRLIKQRNRRKRLWTLFSNSQIRAGEPITRISETELDSDALRRALDRLPVKEKEAILMFEIAGLSLKEIQEIQKDSLSAVKSRLSRGKAKLTKILTEKKTSEGKIQKQITTLEPAILIHPIHEILKSETK